MGGQEPSNHVLAAKIDAMREIMEIKFDENKKDHDRVNNHLTELNGQVKKNTDFRLKTGAIVGLAVFVIPTAVSLILNKIF